MAASGKAEVYVNGFEQAKNASLQASKLEQHRRMIIQEIHALENSLFVHIDTSFQTITALEEKIKQYNTTLANLALDKNGILYKSKLLPEKLSLVSLESAKERLQVRLQVKKMLAQRDARSRETVSMYEEKLQQSIAARANVIKELKALGAELLTIDLNQPLQHAKDLFFRFEKTYGDYNAMNSIAASDNLECLSLYQNYLPTYWSAKWEMNAELKNIYTCLSIIFLKPNREAFDPDLEFIEKTKDSEKSASSSKVGMFKPALSELDLLHERALALHNKSHFSAGAKQ